MRIVISRLLLIAILATGAFGCRKTETTVSDGQSAEVTTDAEASSTVTETVQPPAIAAGFDVTGAYFPVAKFSGEFAELDFLSLANIDENAAPAPLNGFLRPKVMSATDYVLDKPKIDEMRLTFTTAVVGGIQYSFEGAFTVLDDFPNQPPAYDFVVLAGTLTKIRDGKTVAATPVKFRYEAGG